ncbi:MAG: CpaF family protein [Methanobrevibacter wolinii]|uniref:CpaF family protein n=1 Tax=Methanobrevibacter wolinii TaxID=190977 RepID=UPI0005B28C97|nr:CpaF family protein [Methanobrevibacter wolinii]
MTTDSDFNIVSTNNGYKYNVQNIFGFTFEEKTILSNIRSKLVDVALNNESRNDIKLNDIKLIIRNSILNDSFDKEYIDNLSQRFYEEINGYGILNPLIKDDNLEEIMVIGSNKPIYVYHRKYGMLETNISFSSNEEIIKIIDLIARKNNRRVDNESPILDARLKDGSRVNATLAPISADGPSITIRKFKKDPFTIIDLIKNKTLNSNLAAFLWLCIDGLGVESANIIISGGTSSGKTTTLNALSAFINPKERIITIEDTLELQIPHKHILRMETRLSNIEGKGKLDMDALVKNALRQRPDRIIVGEVRSKEAITLFTALNTGHSGFGTLHANNARETITRLTNPPMCVPKIMISAIDFILMEKRFYKSNGVSYRRVTELSEVVGIEEGTIQLNKIFQWNPSLDDFENITFSSNTVERIMRTRNISRKYIDNEIKIRELVLELMVENNLRSNNVVSKIIEFYYINKDKLLSLLKNSPKYFLRFNHD